VKKLLLLFIFIYLLGCSSIRNESTEIAVIDCPRVFFSSENKVYIDGLNDTIDLEKVNFKASLNNYGFVGDCVFDKEYNNINIDLLIITEPINPKDENVNLPIFILFYNENDELVERQFFRINSTLNYNEDTSKYETTDIIENLNIFVENNKKINSITIGFVKIK
tara:strand:- start:1179 stop:1673 length:495 start_codon:yes stop_codon:yes gene_type:complete